MVHHLLKRPFSIYCKSSPIYVAVHESIPRKVLGDLASWICRSFLLPGNLPDTRSVTEHLLLALKQTQHDLFFRAPEFTEHHTDTDINHLILPSGLPYALVWAVCSPSSVHTAHALLLIFHSLVPGFSRPWRQNNREEVTRHKMDKKARLQPQHRMQTCQTTSRRPVYSPQSVLKD